MPAPRRSQHSRAERPRAVSDVAPRSTRLTVLVGDPLVSADGAPLSTNWRIPWTRFIDHLFDALRRTGRSWRIDVQPATRGRLAQVAPRSRFLALLCHGNRVGLSFESDERAGVLHAVLADELKPFFGDAPPDVVLVLACEGRAAADSIHMAGVPVTFGVYQGDVLHWREAVDVAERFFGALGSGYSVESATAQASGVPPRGGGEPAPDFEWSRAAHEPALVPSGAAALAVSLNDWCAPPVTEVFVGRKLTLPELMEAVSVPGIVQVIGPPGSGKTELARVLLDRCRLARWPHGGSAFVPLEGVTTVKGLLDALAPARPAAVQAVEHATPAQLGNDVGVSERLIVLDHLDDVLDNADTAVAVRSFLASAGQARPELRARLVLTSTRELSGLARTSPVIPVGGLESDGEAAWLLEGTLRGSFVTRGERVDELWQRVKGHADYAKLIGALGRHPLTVVWAGKALRSGTPLTAVLQDVEREQGGVGVLLDELRQRVEHARPNATELWVLIAELPAGLPGAAVLAEDDRLDLEALRQYSALESSLDDWRLAGTVRQYLMNCRASGAIAPPADSRRERVHAAIAHAVIASLERIESKLRGPQGALALRTFGELCPTIGHLLGSTSAPGWPALCGRKGRLSSLAGEVANYAGRPDLARRWTLGAVDDPHLEDDRIRTLLVHAEAALLLHDSATARQMAELARQGAVKRGEHIFAARALRQLADATFDGPERDLDGAEQLYRQALAMFAQAGDEARVAQLHYCLAELARHRYHNAEAVRLYLLACKIHARLEDRLGEGRASRALGELFLRQGRTREAARWLSRAARLLESVGVRWDQAATSAALGKLRLEALRVTAARRHLDEACQLYVGLGERLGEANVRLLLGDLAMHERDFGEARASYNRAGELFEAVANARGSGLVQQRLGELALRSNQVDDALACARAAGACAATQGDEINAAAARVLEARALQAAGRPSEALKAAMEASTHARRAGAAVSARGALDVVARLAASSHPRVSAALGEVLRGPAAAALEFDISPVAVQLDAAPAVARPRPRRASSSAGRPGRRGTGARSARRAS